MPPALLYSLVAVAVSLLVAQPSLATGRAASQSGSVLTVQSSAPLLKPPLMNDPRRALIQQLVRSTYPDLFGTSAAPGWVAVTLLINPDGTLYKGYKDETEQHPYHTNSLKAFDLMGEDYEHRGDRVQLDVKAGFKEATRLSIRAFFLKPIGDRTRDIALVRASVNARYRGLYMRSSAEILTELTVFMTEDGAIQRAKVRSRNALEADVAPTPDRFIAMGILRDRIGPIGKAMLYEGAYENGTKSQRLLVVYAWPRRQGERVTQPWRAEQSGPVAPNDDPSVDRAIAEKYFPDLYTYTKPKSELNADFWVLLDRKGEVKATGRRYLASSGDLKVYLEALYPGIETDGFEPVEFKGDHGRMGVVNFTWIAPDSPITDLAKADLAKRSDFTLYAQITGAGVTTMTSLTIPKFGAPAIAVDDNKDLNVQVVGISGGPNSVVLRARIQHVQRARPSDFQWGVPHAAETAWSEETLPVRVRYGESTDVLLTDRDNNQWLVALHPNRMQGSIQ